MWAPTPLPTPREERDAWLRAPAHLDAPDWGVSPVALQDSMAADAAAKAAAMAAPPAPEARSQALERLRVVHDVFARVAVVASAAAGAGPSALPLDRTVRPSLGWGRLAAGPGGARSRARGALVGGAAAAGRRYAVAFGVRARSGGGGAAVASLCSADALFLSAGHESRRGPGDCSVAPFPKRGQGREGHRARARQPGWPVQ